MADSRGIMAGRAYVELGVSDNLSKGLRTAEKQLKAFAGGLKTYGAALAGIGGGAIAALAGAAKAFAESGGGMVDLSKRTGLTVEALSELKYVAKLSGVDIESLALGIKKMQLSISSAASGSREATETLAALGLAVEDVVGKGPEQQFNLIADRISRIEDPADRAAAAVAVFGKRGSDLLPVMDQGAAGITRLREQARSLGLTMTAEAAASADQLDDALDGLHATGDKLYKTVGSALAPSLVKLAEFVSNAAKSATEWISAHKSAVVTAAAVAAAAALVGTAMLGVGVAISATLAVVTAIGAAFSGVMAVVGALGSILLGLVSPLGVVLAALAACGVALFKFSGYGDKVLSWLSDRFRSLVGIVGEVIHAVSAALTAGEWGAAAEVAWAAIRVAFLTGKAAVLDTIKTLGESMTSSLQDAFLGIEICWINTCARMNQAALRFGAALRAALVEDATWVHAVWNNMGDGLGGGNADQENISLFGGQQQFTEEVMREAERNAVKEEQRARAARDKAVRDAAKRNPPSPASQPAETHPEVDAAKKRLQDAIKKANDAHDAYERGRRDVAPTPPGAPPEADKIDYAAGRAAARLGSVGSFNAAGLFGLGGGGAAERTADATEKANKIMENILAFLRRAKETQATFR